MDPNMQSMEAMAAQQGQPQGQPVPQEAVPPEQQGKPSGDESTDMAEIERGLQAITKALYTDEAASNAFAQALNPQDPVGSVTKASIQLVTQIDNQLNLSERSIAPLAVIGCGELMELGEAAHGMQMDESQQQQAVMATWEGVLAAYGVNQEDSANFAGSTSEQEQTDAVSMYEGAMK